ncbi:DUF6265 family protein [Sphingomicrobium flavum]|uniref:DUF6265 family protein n=1 Tax=Sphingomicrobium flavum TaxID=1229164 RepID=UPI0021AD98A4|nr:DUF6265 family protein [Sphingomicrobium flavum]
MNFSLFLAALALSAAHPAKEHEDEAAAAAVSPFMEHAEWLQGRWVGTGMGGEVEEVWSPPNDNQMVGHFIYKKDGKIVFYELLLLRPDAEGVGLEMLVKHFDRDFTAWEDKDEWITFKAEMSHPGLILMKGLSLRRDGETLEAVVTMKQADGSIKDVPFIMQRVAGEGEPGHQH